jgi:hypothetical protein
VEEAWACNLLSSYHLYPFLGFVGWIKWKAFAFLSSQVAAPDYEEFSSFLLSSYVPV